MAMHSNPNYAAATAAVRKAVRSFPEQPHPAPAWSLFLDKFSFSRDSEEAEAKTQALRDACDFYARAHPHLAESCAAQFRWLDALAAQLSPARFASITLTNDAPLTLHLGRASVLKNVGLFCDRSTGLPIIPGTALKGIMSNWAYWEGYFGESGALGEIAMPEKPGGRPDQRERLTRHWIEQHGPDHSDRARRILGSDHPDGSQHAGDIVFLGGFPLQPPKLGLEIVNPHHDAKGNPATTLTPSVFLVLEPGTVWRIAFHARAGLAPAAATDLLGTTERWAREALSAVGLGAKSASGFGRARPSTPEEIAAATPKVAPIPEPAPAKAKPSSKTAPPDYASYTAKKRDWTALAGDILGKPEWERAHIVAYFTTEEGRALALVWKGPNGEMRRANLRTAGWQDPEP
jgi:CRISPR type III-B/RAMP module RAMP protein Cmr6